MDRRRTMVCTPVARVMAMFDSFMGGDHKYVFSSSAKKWCVVCVEENPEELVPECAAHMSAGIPGFAIGGQELQGKFTAQGELSKKRGGARPTQEFTLVPGRETDVLMKSQTVFYSVALFEGKSPNDQNLFKVVILKKAVTKGHTLNIQDHHFREGPTARLVEASSLQQAVEKLLAPTTPVIAPTPCRNRPSAGQAEGQGEAHIQYRHVREDPPARQVEASSLQQSVELRAAATPQRGAMGASSGCVGQHARSSMADARPLQIAPSTPVVAPASLGGQDPVQLRCGRSSLGQGEGQGDAHCFAASSKVQQEEHMFQLAFEAAYTKYNDKLDRDSGETIASALAVVDAFDEREQARDPMRCDQDSWYRNYKRVEFARHVLRLNASRVPSDCRSARSSTASNKYSKIREVFFASDLNYNGTLDWHTGEIKTFGKRLLAAFNIQPPSWDNNHAWYNLYRIYDTNNDGQMDINEGLQFARHVLALFDRGLPESFLPSSMDEFTLQRGEKVEYFSESSRHWVPARVKEIGSEGEVWLSCKEAWISLHEQSRKVRRLACACGDAVARGAQDPTVRRRERIEALQVGEAVEYFSESVGGRWVPSLVEAIGSPDGVRLSCRQTWISPHEQSTKVRRLTWACGDAVQFLEPGAHQWVSTHVSRVAQDPTDGRRQNIEIACKENAIFDASRQNQQIRRASVPLVAPAAPEVGQR